jgi:hypothetical protein
VKPTERAVQREIVRELRKLDLAVVHVPNGGQYRGNDEQRMRYAIAKRIDGEVAGFPDLIILTRKGLPRVGFLEVKRPGEKPNERQLSCHADLALCGHPVAVVKSLDDALAALTAWGFIGLAS